MYNPVLSFVPICYTFPMAKTSKKQKALFAVEFGRETDGRWIADPQLPGVMAYGATKRDALQHVYRIGLRQITSMVFA